MCRNVSEIEIINFLLIFNKKNKIDGTIHVFIIRLGIRNGKQSTSI